MRTGRPSTVRTERQIEEVAMLVRPNRSQSIDDLAAVEEFSRGTCYKILTDDLKCRFLPNTVCHASCHKTNVMIA